MAECLKLPIVDVTEFLLRRLAARQGFDHAPLFSFRDAIALAVHANAPIVISRQLLDSAGVDMPE